MVHSFLKGLDPLHQKALTLTAGQIFSGKILKLYPGQLASLQLGGQRLTAKLEAALTVGNRYWFQVQHGDGIPVLKVLEGSTGQKTNGPSDNNSVLRQLGLQKSKLNETILNFLANKEQPFSLNHIKMGAEVLQKSAMVNERGLTILQVLVERNLPITFTSFLAIQSVIEGPSLSSQLEQLSQSLQKISEKDGYILRLEQVLKTLSTEVAKIDQHNLRDLLVNYFTSDQKSSLFLQSESDLQKLGLIQKGTSPNEFLGQLREKVTTFNEEQLKQYWPTLTKPEIITAFGKNSIEGLLSKLALPTGEKGEKLLEQLFGLNPKNIENSFPTTGNDLEKTELAKQFSAIANLIGFQYERDLLTSYQQQGRFDEKLLNQIKSLLIHAQKTELPIEVKENTETILHRITGQQLLSVHLDGPISNHAIVLPLKLQGRNVDLTIQWESKKGKNGELDPNHCRILFYVNLEHLKETVVDVQIQNRIVSLQIFNDKERPTMLIKALQPHLHDALLELNYQLSSVKWTQSKQPSNGKKQTNHLSNYYQAQKSYQGVDIRI